MEESETTNCEKPERILDSVLQDPLLDGKLIDTSFIKVEVLDEHESELIVEELPEINQSVKPKKVKKDKRKKAKHKNDKRKSLEQIEKKNKKLKTVDSNKSECEIEDATAVYNCIKDQGSRDDRGVWSCTKCGKPYKNDSAFIYHLRRKHDLESDLFVNQCEYCHMDFILVSSLRRHVGLVHYRDKKLGVKEKNKESESRREEECRQLKEHGKLDSDGSWWCSGCGTKCADSTKFVYHLKRFHNVGVGGFHHKCAQCQLEFRTAPALRSHIQRVHCLALKTGGNAQDEYGAWWCVTCGLRYTKHNMYLLHQRKVHQAGEEDIPLQYTCKYCSAAFGKMGVLNRHIRNLHPDKFAQGSDDSSESSSLPADELSKLTEHGSRNRSGTWLCNSCSGVYSGRTSFVRHLKRQHGVTVGPGTYDCRQCGECCLSERALHNHVSAMHNVSDAELSDSVESSLIQESDRLLQHGTRKADTAVWQCNRCDKSYDRAVRFAYHLKRSHDVEVRGFPFRCEECQLCFLTQKALDAHGKTHTKDDAASSNTNAAADSNLLREGRRCSDGGWECKRCGAKYIKEGNFLYHVRRFHSADVTSSMKHKCDTCAMEFISLVALQCHERKKHSSDDTGEMVPTTDEKEGENEDDKPLKSKGIVKDSDSEDDLLLSEIKKEVDASNATANVAPKPKRKKDMTRRKFTRLEQITLEKEIMNREGKRDSEGCWWCGKCGLRYTKDGIFLYHLKRAHDISIGTFEYTCVYCKMEFISKAALRTHINRVHPEANENLFKNSSEFLQSSIIENHAKIVESTFTKDTNDQWICKACGSKFVRDASCLYHLKRDHNMFIEGFDYKCNICNMEYSNPSALRIHVKRVHSYHEDKIMKNCVVNGNKWVCKDCGKEFLKRNGFIYHYGRYHEAGEEIFKYQCKLCKSKYISSKGLRLHLVTVHGQVNNTGNNVEVIKPDRKPVLNGIKVDVSVKKQVYDDDSNSKNNNVPFAKDILETDQDGIHQCRSCGYLLSSRKYLMDHLQVTHPTEFSAIHLVLNAYELEDEGYCKICKLNFYNPGEFERHINFEHNRKDCENIVMRCQQCPFITMSEFVYRMHSKTLHGVSDNHSSEWPCRKCNLRFDNREFLQNHIINGACYIIVHENEYECTECRRRFQMRNDMMKHVEEYHAVETNGDNQICFKIDVVDEFGKMMYSEYNNQNNHQCIICKKNFVELSQLKSHIQEDHKYQGDKSVVQKTIVENEDLKCEKCSIDFPDKTAYTTHMVNHHNTTKYLYNNNPTCSLCSQEFSNNSSLRRHIQVIHVKKSPYRYVNMDAVRKPATCVVCSDVFRSQLAMLKHFRTTHIDDPLISGNNSFTVIPRSDLDLNKPLKKRSDKLYKCKLCAFSSKRKEGIEAHLINKHWNGVKPLQCSYCTYKTTTQKQLDNHLYQMHPNTQEAKDTTSLCEDCGKTFTNKITFYQHRESHNPPKYKCEYCNYSTHLKTSIDNHKRKHTKEKPFHCDFEGCNYSCTSQTGLRVHKFTHEPEKNMQCCDLCGYKTVNKYLMNSHMREHKRESVNYSCEHCSYSSTDKAQLSMHCKRHMDAKSCQLCDFSTKYKQTMKKHLKKRHGIVVSKDENIKWF